MDWLRPTNDLVFKLLFGGDPELLSDMLQAVLGRPVRDVRVENPELPGDFATEKRIILDLRVTLGDGTRAIVEMQVLFTPTSHHRMLFYGCREHARQLKRGEDYAALRPTIVIVWTADEVFPDVQQLHDRFWMQGERSGKVFSEQLEIHLLQLPMLQYEHDPHDTVARWARFLVAQSDTEFNQLAAESLVMQHAKDRLKHLSNDPDTRRLAQEREEAALAWQIELGGAREEGEARGRAESVLGVLDARDMALSDEQRRRILSCPDLAQLDAWLRGAVTTTSVKDLLADDERTG